MQAPVLKGAGTHSKLDLWTQVMAFGLNDIWNLDPEHTLRLVPPVKKQEILVTKQEILKNKGKQN